MLTDHVSDPDVLDGLDELDLAKGEVVMFAGFVPVAETLLGLWPTGGDGEDEAGAPGADVVANVSYDFIAIALGTGGVADEVGNRADFIM